MIFEEESIIYKIFISHTGQTKEEYSIFIEKLSKAYNFEWKNYSILENNKTNVTELQKQIESAGIVIILSGLYNKHKKIIKKQIDIAKALNKPMIVIRPYGMEEVPPELEKIAADIVGWNAPCIVDAIQENYLEEQ